MDTSPFHTSNKDPRTSPIHASRAGATSLGTGQQFLRSTSSPASLEAAESEVKSLTHHNSLYLFFVNGYSALLVFAFYLISWEAIFGICLSVGLTVFVYYHADDSGAWDGGTMDWVLLSFAVITPISASIGMAFTRREQSLHHIAAFRATAYEMYCAHSAWDWCKAGKCDTTGRIVSDVNWVHHSDAVLSELIGIGDELCRFLTLPTVSRARHRVTRAGRKEAGQTIQVAYRLFHSLLTIRMGKLTKLCEVLKREGLPPNEATRIRQWERMIVEDIESLRMVKTYRTPQALRSFGRLFTVFLPAFYAPWYAQLARDMNSLGMGVAFAVLTALALASLFESISVLEDPFVATLTLDGIDVREELTVLHYHQLVSTRGLFFPDAEPFSEEARRKGEGVKGERARVEGKTEGDDGSRVPSLKGESARAVLNPQRSGVSDSSNSLGKRESSYVDLAALK